LNIVGRLFKHLVYGFLFAYLSRIFIFNNTADDFLLINCIIYPFLIIYIDDLIGLDILYLKLDSFLLNYEIYDDWVAFVAMFIIFILLWWSALVIPIIYLILWGVTKKLAPWLRRVIM